MGSLGIGHIIGLIAFVCLVIFIVYQSFIKHLFSKGPQKALLPSNYEVLHSRSQLDKLSAERAVLLITDNVTEFLPLFLWEENDARNTFEQTHLQTLHSLTKDKNITICWFNIDSGIRLRHSGLHKELINYLKKEGLLKKGFSLFKEGKLIKHEPIDGKLNTKNKKTIGVVEEILNDVS